MTTAPRAFRRSAEKKTKVARPVVTFVLESFSDTETDEEGNPVLVRSDTFTATMPSDERLFVIAAQAGQEDGGGPAEAAAVVDMLKDALPKQEYSILRRRLIDPDDDVDLEMLQDVMGWLMEEWSNFPTQPASVSSTSQVSTGAKSTGRVRGEGSTH